MDKNININIGAHNTSWSANLDVNFHYSGYSIVGNDWAIEPGENVRSVLITFANAIKCLEENSGSIPVLPVVVLDEDIDINTTGEYLNNNYPSVELNSIVHNGLDIKFTKLTAQLWEFQIIELR